MAEYITKLKIYDEDEEPGSPEPPRTVSAAGHGRTDGCSNASLHPAPKPSTIVQQRRGTMPTQDIRKQVALALEAVNNKKAEDVSLLQLPGSRAPLPITF